jgi:hypothetical protein
MSQNELQEKLESMAEALGVLTEQRVKKSNDSVVKLLGFLAFLITLIILVGMVLYFPYLEKGHLSLPTPPNDLNNCVYYSLIDEDSDKWVLDCAIN